MQPEQADERRRALRELGRQRFEEYRLATEVRDGAVTVALKDNQKQASTQPPWQTGTPERDALIMEIEKLLQDKQELVRANEQLKRENLQLHELLGFLASHGMNDAEPEC